ncbi:MAG TPA: PAS domain S-box protein [Coleofasciculaceae cyanobacterium]
MQDSITRCQQAEAALRQSEARFQRIAASVPGVIYQFLWHSDGSVAFPFVSPSCREIYEVEAQEIQADANVLISMIHPEDLEDFNHSIALSIETLRSWYWEGRFILPSGQLKWVQAASIPELQANGDILWDGLLMDITVRKQGEEALRQAREELELRVEERLAQFRQANEQLRFTQFSMDYAPEAIFCMDANAQFFYVNEAACQLLGYSREELLSMSIQDVDLNFPTQSWSEYWEELKSQSSFTLESTNRASDGRIFPIELSVNYLEFNGQEYNCVFVRDTTKRKQAEEALRESEERFRRLVEQAVDTIIVHDIEGQILDANQQACDSLGYSREELLTLSIADIEDNYKPGAVWQYVIHGLPVTVNSRQRRKDGTSFPVEVRLGLLEFKGQQLILSLTRDITERKRAEEALQESEAKFRSIVENANDIIFRVTPDGVFSYISPNWSDILGHEVSEVEGKVFTPFVHPDDLPICLGTLHRAIETGHKQSGVEYRVRHKNGTWRWHTSNLAVLKDASGEVVSLVGIARDISDRKQAEEALRESEERFRNLVESTNDFIWEVDENALYTYVSPQIRDILGYEVAEVVGKTPFDLMPPEEAYRVAEMISNQVALRRPLTNLENTNLHKDGHLVVLETSGVPFFDKAGNFKGYRGIDRDITKRKQTEEAIRQSKAQLQQQAAQLEQTLRQLKNTQVQLIQTEKMSSLGQLMAGVAHEINNPVSFIYGNINHARRYTADLLKLIRLYQDIYPQSSPAIEEEIEAIDLNFIEEDFPRLLGSMEVGSKRIQRIVESLRNFSRFDEATIKQVDIHQGIDSTLMLLQSRLTQHLIPAAIQVIKNYGNLPLVECYPGHLNQVFMNILNNAIDALDEANSSKSPLETETNPSTIRICTEFSQESSPNPQVVIRIADNGGGMTEEVRLRAFDPFFTTKPVGEGAGLGLAISYQIIVELHKGQLYCNSSPGEGTELVIQIPIGQSRR